MKGINGNTSRFKKITFLMLTLLGVWIASTEAQAAYCTVVGGTRTTTFSNLVIQRDTPVGTLLAENTIPVSQVWNCSSAVGVVSSQNIGVKAYGTYNAMLDGVRVYNTDVTGVGYALAVIGNGIGGCAGTWNIIAASDQRLPCWNAGIFNGGDVRQGYQVRLYKTGTAASGAVTGRRIGAGITDIAGVWDNEVPVNINNFRVTALACSLTNSTISVPLGDVQSSAFTGITTTAGDKTFNLGLSCDKDANINVALAGSQNADTADTSVLALTNAGQSGTASGVGVQLLYGSVPLKLNNNILLKASAGGQETLPFSARYYQTQTAIGAGLANSSATLNITYQ
jgi:type 1 fimbria pilin